LSDVFERLAFLLPSNIDVEKSPNSVHIITASHCRTEFYKLKLLHEYIR